MANPKLEYAGIDGCKSGWLYVGIDDKGQFHFGVKRKFEDVIRILKDARLILVDMPIGLPSSRQTKRYCDVAARKAISPRGSSVFPVPARSSLAQPTYEKGSAENARILGKKLSTQSWAIAPKIREVDDFMRQQGAQSRVREMHPEVAFWALNFERPLIEKKTKVAGENERLSVLSHHYPLSVECFEACKNQYLRKDVAKDDILDALVGAVTAMQAPNIATLPPNPVFDEEGLPMEMVYASTLSASPDEQGKFYHELESAAAETLGRIIFALTRFEFNLALALRHATASPGKAKFELRDDQINLKSKLDKLLKIVESRFSSKPECISEFTAWYRNMDLVRRKRNAFVHGRWGISPARQRIVNVSDDFPGVGEEGVTNFTLGALERELDVIERLEADFQRFRVRWNLF